MNGLERIRKEKKKYGDLLENYKSVYESYAPYRLAYYYLLELIYRNGIEIAQMA